MEINRLNIENPVYNHIIYLYCRINSCVNNMLKTLKKMFTITFRPAGSKDTLVVNLKRKI